MYENLFDNGFLPIRHVDKIIFCGFEILTYKKISKNKPKRFYRKFFLFFFSKDLINHVHNLGGISSEKSKHHEPTGYVLEE